MPWAIFNRPSIQLGALKSYLEQKTDCRVDTFHPYLHAAKALGTDQYSQLALSGWGGEALFSPLLFAEQQGPAAQLFQESMAGKISHKPSFVQMSETVADLYEQWLTTHDMSQYRLIGFSVCFSQLLPSLFLARRIKARYGKIPVVFGGSSCSGPLAASLIDHFPEIDYVIDGEGEEALICLYRSIDDATLPLPGVIHHRHKRPKETHAIAPVRLDELPFPDYTPYFKEMQELFPGQPFIPILPVEFSRGCWWNRCTFCNLNLQWHDYRYKHSNRMLREIAHLSAVHESLHFTFTDNALPPREAEPFFRDIAQSGRDFDFFAEIRARTAPQQLQAFSRGGLRTVQVGIESLSTALLRKMDKGTTVIDNITVMKLCTQYGIRMTGNLITEFPGTTTEEIAETLENLDFVFPFVPLEAATFFLGLGSPIYAHPENYSIQAILPHAKIRRLFPQRCVATLSMLINSYRGDRTHQHAAWKPVKAKIAAWHTFHQNRPDSHQPPLHYRDGGTFLIIRQESPGGKPLLHRLRGLSRKIYLHCTLPVTVNDLLAAFPSIKETALRQFISDMCRKRLMFQEKERILSLAVRYVGRSSAPAAASE